MNQINFAKALVVAILDKEHQHVNEDPMDDSEFIPLLRRIIEASSEKLVRLGLDSDETSQFKTDLHQYVKEKYIALWMIHAHEQEGEDINTKKEVKAASQTFEKHWNWQPLT